MRFFVVLIAVIFFVLSAHQARAQTSVQNGCIAVTATSVADNFTGVDLSNNCNYPVSAYVCEFGTAIGTSKCNLSAVQVTPSASPGQPLIVNGLSSLDVPLKLVPNNGMMVNFVEFECPAGSDTIKNTTFSSTAGAPPCASVTTSNVAAAALPDAFAVEVDQRATVFATIENTTATALKNCRIALVQPAQSELEFAFQQTNPTTNAPIGSPNTAVNIAAEGSGTFVLSFESPLALNMRNLPLEYACDGTIAMLSQAGISSVDVNISSTPIANVVAGIATESNNGIFTVPLNGEGAFAIASDNAGNASGAVTVTTDTGNTSLPLTLTICQTNSTTGACLAPAASSVSLTIAQGAKPTFTVFAIASGNIAFAPGANRVFVRFEVNGAEVGATSVAVQT
ncbi:MAG: hypothetical protein WCC64_09370 [Aliidongia sp.]